MKGFIVNQINKGRTYSTIVAYIQALKNYFDDNKLDNLTKDISFKHFKSGIRRYLKGETCPNAKLPFEITWFQLIIDNYPLNMYENRLLFFYLTLAFSAFLRISELMSLKKSDIKLSSDEKILSLHIEFSKTDQFGRGTLSYIYLTDKPWCPIPYVDVLDNFGDDEKIVKLTESALRSRLRYLSKTIGVVDFDKYNWHSFRRGGAFYCGINGVPDYLIKAHGRWKSTSYIRYVSVEMTKAGEEVSNALQNF